MNANVLRFHIWITHTKVGDRIFLLSELSPILELLHFKQNNIEISLARYLKTRLC